MCFLSISRHDRCGRNESIQTNRINGLIVLYKPCLLILTNQKLKWSKFPSIETTPSWKQTNSIHVICFIVKFGYLSPTWSEQFGGMLTFAFKLSVLEGSWDICNETTTVEEGTLITMRFDLVTGALSAVIDDMDFGTLYHYPVYHNCGFDCCIVSRPNSSWDMLY